MIGKFRVELYSAFLVNNSVSVASKHPKSDAQYMWELVNGEPKLYVALFSSRMQLPTHD